MNQFQTKCQLLTPRGCFLKDMVVLAQAWDQLTGNGASP